VALPRRLLPPARPTSRKPAARRLAVICVAQGPAERAAPFLGWPRMAAVRRFAMSVRFWPHWRKIPDRWAEVGRRPIPTGASLDRCALLNGFRRAFRPGHGCPISRSAFARVDWHGGVCRRRLRRRPGIDWPSKPETGFRHLTGAFMAANVCPEPRISFLMVVRLGSRWVSMTSSWWNPRSSLGPPTFSRRQRSCRDADRPLRIL